MENKSGSLQSTNPDSCKTQAHALSEVVGTLLSCQVQPYLGGALFYLKVPVHRIHDALIAIQCILPKNADESVKDVQNCIKLIGKT